MPGVCICLQTSIGFQSFPCRLTTGDRNAVTRFCSRKHRRQHLDLGCPCVASATVSYTATIQPQLLQTVDVSLGDRSYPIYIGQGLLDRSDLLQQHILGKKVLVVTNETVAPLYLERFVLGNRDFQPQSRTAMLTVLYQAGA